MKGKKIYIPQAAEEILKLLNENGFEAYIVGGYVRDAVIGRECGDIDITTNALPEEVIKMFGDHYISKTGLTHGTVGVIYKGESYEITTYRIDGEYKDHRHPDSVVYSKSLTEDLARRDFTINTLYYGTEDGVGDKYGGIEDLNRKLIRTVGEPVKRFTEDSLRILRGLRFASQLGFKIDGDTLEGMIKTKELLYNISSERIAVEFIKTVCSPFFNETAKSYPHIFSAIVSDIFSRANIGFSDNEAFEELFSEGAECAAKVSGSIYLKLAAFLTVFDNAYLRIFPDLRIGDMTKKFLTSLKCSGKIIHNVHYLVKKHDVKIFNNKKSIAAIVCESSPETLLELLSLQKALCESRRICCADIEKTELLLKELLSRGDCLVPSQLNINGRDIIALGCKDGRVIGYILEKLYTLVIEDKLENKKEVLTEYASHMSELKIH